MSETAVCKLLGKTHKTLRSWRKRYESGGLESLLCIKKGRGRHPLISSPSLISKVIDELEESRDGGRIRCQDIVDYLRDKQKIEYSLPGMYHVLHRLGFSWITARSKHPEQSEKEIEDFKKKLR
jgi:transposase